MEAEVFGIHHATVGAEDDGSFDDVLEFADIVFLGREAGGNDDGDDAQVRRGQVRRYQGLRKRRRRCGT
jgi:hypothetical protein